MKRLAEISVILGMAFTSQGCAVYPSGGAVAYTDYGSSYGSSYTSGPAYSYPAYGYNSYGYYGGYSPSLSYNYYGGLPSRSYNSYSYRPHNHDNWGGHHGWQGRHGWGGVADTIGAMEGAPVVAAIIGAEVAPEVAAIIGAEVAPEAAVTIGAEVPKEAVAMGVETDMVDTVSPRSSD
ncbi:hypothetical protein [Candidatus Methylomicrobium oryzae]|uniref:hypothetical protein n=1 Tax=Candidatus Methylomicrobium oryzae TaxID=2802053 RepID=UPI001922530C|nr:hypothetical protein [Methylomicrobium sp. RS1]MBL1265045.1 hypothetical protein [Methylomicrobium sp. RS1]